MTRKVLLLSGIFGLLSALPAHASPTNKTITITCSSGYPNTIIGEVDVTLYDSLGNSYDCAAAGSTFLVACDSSGGSVLPGVPATNSASCTPGFRVYEMSYSLFYNDYDSSLTSIASGSVTGAGIILRGSGFSTQIVSSSSSADSVTLKVK